MENYKIFRVNTKWMCEIRKWTNEVEENEKELYQIKDSYKADAIWVSIVLDYEKWYKL